MNDSVSHTAGAFVAGDPKASGLLWRLAKDRWAARLVIASGLSVILIILGIFFVIAYEVYPLLKKPQVEPLKSVSMDVPGSVLTMDADEYGEVAFVAMSDGLKFFSLRDGKPLPQTDAPESTGLSAVSASSPQGQMVVLGTADGQVLPVNYKFPVDYKNGVRHVGGAAVPGKLIALSPQSRPVTLLSHYKGESGYTVAGRLTPKEIAVARVRQKRSLMGGVREQRDIHSYTVPFKGNITALVVGDQGGRVFVGTHKGQILGLSLSPRAGEPEWEVLAAMPESGQEVHSLGLVKGGKTLVAGSDSGQVYSFVMFRGEDQRVRLDLVRQFESHARPVILFAPSRRDKGFFTGDADGVMHYHYSTTGETPFTLRLAGGKHLQGMVFLPKGNGFLALGANHNLDRWRIHNPHPETTWHTLFGKVRYEGYPKAEYVWQSTGGTDDFEPKLSLVPLIFGTLKGTIYAMLVAAPLALLGAIYASQFMATSWKGFVKPTIEFMAAIPSVVLGFIGALWLAPRLESLFPGIALFPWVMVALIFGYYLINEYTSWKSISKKWPGIDLICFLLIVVLGGVLAMYLGRLVEAWFLQGNYRAWMLDFFGLQYEQRNSLVVGIAMGFAVVPIVFTIAEDSLSSVPKHLAAGSLALGATRWQTAVRVILPTASPGIFSALMIGFGRAVGETMIVLMATGNTPIMDWNVFNGFRALSANIAVELPEAPEGGTLFRVLFLTALLLYLGTFLINSLAEWVRLRLRERYRVI